MTGATLFSMASVTARMGIRPQAAWGRMCAGLKALWAGAGHCLGKDGRVRRAIAFSSGARAAPRKRAEQARRLGRSGPCGKWDMYQ